MTKQRIDFALPRDAFMGPHCGVQAVAIVAGKSLNEMLTYFKQTRPIARGNRWSGGTRHHDRVAVLDDIGAAYDVMTRNDMPGYERRKINLAQFVARFAKPGKVYMVTTTGHVQLVKDGVVLDQGGPKPIAEFRGRRKYLSADVLVFDAAAAADSYFTEFGLPLFDRLEAA